VEDFSDPSQNVARAVGQAQIKQIYECINLSTRYVLSFMDGQIGEVQLKEFLFGHDGITTLCGTGTSNSHQIASLRSIHSQSNQRKRNRNGEGEEAKKQALPLDPIPVKRIASMHGWAGMPSGSWRQVERAMPFETGWTKKIQSTEGWREMPDHGWEGTKYAMPSDPGNGQQLMRGWGGTRCSVAGLQGGVHSKGWGGTQEPFARCSGGTIEPIAGGWGGVHAEDWGRTQEPVVESRDQVHAEGWGGIRQPIAEG
ncbi:Hypothetical predicted protein, partial [Olea europaea subsp. europaea]